MPSVFVNEPSSGNLLQRARQVLSTHCTRQHYGRCESGRDYVQARSMLDGWLKNARVRCYDRNCWMCPPRTCHFQLSGAHRDEEWCELTLFFILVGMCQRVDEEHGHRNRRGSVYVSR